MNCSVSVPNEDDLTILISKISRLERDNIIQNHTSVANLWRQALTSEDPRAQAVAVGPGMERGESADSEALLALQKEKGWGFWKGYFAIYSASAEIGQANWALVKKTFSDVPGAIFTCDEFAGKDGAKPRPQDMPPLEIPHGGKPSMAPLGIVNVRGHGGGHVDFSPLFPPGGKEVNEWYLETREVVKAAKLDFFADFHVFGRNVIAIICIIYGPSEGPRAKKVFQQLLENANKKNTTEYRTHIDFMDHVADSFTFGDSALRRFVTDLKRHIDPNGILSQGKSGIWSSP